MTAHQTHPHDVRPYTGTLDRQEPEQAAADEDDVRRVPVAWEQVVELVEGAKRQNFTEDQSAYFRASLGLCWAKSWRACEAAMTAKENA